MYDITLKLNILEDDTYGFEKELQTNNIRFDVIYIWGSFIKYRISGSPSLVFQLKCKFPNREIELYAENLIFHP